MRFKTRIMLTTAPLNSFEENFEEWLIDEYQFISLVLGVNDESSVDVSEQSMLLRVFGEPLPSRELVSKFEIEEKASLTPILNLIDGIRERLLKFREEYHHHNDDFLLCDQVFGDSANYLPELVKIYVFNALRSYCKKLPVEYFASIGMGEDVKQTLRINTSWVGSNYTMTIPSHVRDGITISLCNAPDINGNPFSEIESKYLSELFTIVTPSDSRFFPSLDGNDIRFITLYDINGKAKYIASGNSLEEALTAMGSDFVFWEIISEEFEVSASQMITCLGILQGVEARVFKSKIKNKPVIYMAIDTSNEIKIVYENGHAHTYSGDKLDDVEAMLPYLERLRLDSLKSVFSDCIEFTE